MKKKNILVVNTGTFCDGMLSQAFLNNNFEKYNIILLTDEKLVPKDKKNKNVYTFQTPSTVYLNTDLPAGDPRKNPILWGITNPFQAKAIYDWVNTIAENILTLEHKYKPDCVILHFALLPSLFIAEYKSDIGLLERTPHVVMYYDPGIINRTIPWLFDSILRSPEFKLYDKVHENDIMFSWNTFLARMAMHNEKPYINNFRAHSLILQKMYHAICWDKSITQQIEPIIPLQTKYIGSPMVYKNAESKKDKKKTVLPSNIYNFLANKKSKNVAFISFGSLVNDINYHKISKSLIKQLVKTGYSVIFHASNELIYNFISDDVLYHHGFVDYKSLVPHLDLVVFAGSLCLQLTCFYNKVPMIFIPKSSEQYFWAKNYEHHTKISYIDIEQSFLQDNITNTIQSLFQNNVKVKRYLDNVSSSLSQNKSKKTLENYVQNLIALYDNKKKNYIY